MRFKKGDQVTVTGGDYFDQVKSSWGGDVATVRFDQGDGSSWVAIETPNGYKNSYEPKDVKLVETNEFKVGDTVIATYNSGDGSQPHDYIKGHEYTVIESTKGHIRTKNYLGVTNGWGTEFFKLADKGVNMNKEYKVGDTVDLTQVLVSISDGSHSEYANGTLFVALNDKDAMKKGEVIELTRNDHTEYPYFRSASRSEFCSFWRNLAELPKGKAQKPAKPSIASTKTIYSDGVEVSETEVRFDGQTHNREALKTLVARYQEILRRPVAAVPAPIVKKKPAAKKTVAKKVNK